MTDAIEALIAREASIHGGHESHQVVVGASGNRAGCRVCRQAAYKADFSERQEWAEPCNPSPTALLLYEANALKQLRGALEMLEHAASFRAAALSPNPQQAEKVG